MKEKLLCSVCGKELTEDNIYEVGGKCLCIDCFESRTSSCACCGERIWTDEVFGDGYLVLYRNCYDRYYTQCEECGAVIHIENACYSDDDEEYPYLRMKDLRAYYQIQNFYMHCYWIECRYL